MHAHGLHAHHARVEEDLGAAEALVADGDDLRVFVCVRVVVGSCINGR